MESKLDLRTESRGKDRIVYLDGRLDASGAGHMNDYIESLVREGNYSIILNMQAIRYLSSAGIRILVSQLKQLKKLGGGLQIDSPSSAVVDTLNMVGMAGMFTGSAVKDADVAVTGTDSLVSDSYIFSGEKVVEGKMTLNVTGNPDLTVSSGFSAGDNRVLRFIQGKYGLGIGAIGDGFDDCRNRYGEFLAIGGAIIYRPSDGSKVPDYAVISGKFEPEINVLVALQASGSFSDRVFFDPAETAHGISLNALTDGFSRITGLNRYVFLMIAESDGLVGIGLNTPPVGNNKIFTYPEIKEQVTFTTEPAYPRMLTVSLGFLDNNPDPGLKPFLRPAGKGSEKMIHTHTAVFPYQALPRNEADPEKLILHLLETSIVQDVMHLIHDSREISGLGDSIFRQGIAWIGKIN